MRAHTYVQVRARMYTHAHTHAREKIFYFLNLCFSSPPGGKKSCNSVEVGTAAQFLPQIAGPPSTVGAYFSRRLLQ